jgi:peroxin-5
MSFLGGAECSTAGNPLSQFTKHVQDDKSLQRDRLVGRGPGGSMQGMRSTNGINMSGSQDNVSWHLCLLVCEMQRFSTFGWMIIDLVAADDE